MKIYGLLDDTSGHNKAKIPNMNCWYIVDLFKILEFQDQVIILLFGVLNSFLCLFYDFVEF